MPDTDGTTDRTDVQHDGVDIPPRHAHHTSGDDGAGVRDDGAGSADDRDRPEETAEPAAEPAAVTVDAPEDTAEDTAEPAEPAAAAPATPFVPAAPAGPERRFTPAAPSGTRRLWNALTQKPDGGQVLVAVLVALLGFGAVLQVRADDDDTLANARRDDLVQILDGLRRQGDRLDDHVTELEADRRDLISGADTEQAALEQAQERARTTGVLAGTIPATGPGIIMILDDTPIAEPENKINGVQLLRAVNELRLAGAEAIQIRGRGNDAEVRVVAETAFQTVRPGAVRVGGVELESPYEVTAIGDASELSGAMTFPEGTVATIETNKGEATVDEYDDLTVDVLHQPRQPQYARPAPEDEDQ